MSQLIIVPVGLYQGPELVLSDWTVANEILSDVCLALVLRLYVPGGRFTTSTLHFLFLWVFFFLGWGGSGADREVKNKRKTYKSPPQVRVDF